MFFTSGVANSYAGRITRSLVDLTALHVLQIVAFDSPDGQGNLDVFMDQHLKSAYTPNPSEMHSVATDALTGTEYPIDRNALR